MTFHVGRGAGSAADPGSWDHPLTPRREAVLGIITEEDPDLIGIQEVLGAQVGDLADGLGALWAWAGVGEDDGLDAGDFNPVFYRTDRFEQVAEGTFWLSETPDEPGTAHPESGSTTTATWVELIETASGRPVVVISTHWAVDSEDARDFGASMIVQKLRFLAPSPIGRVVLGTLNCNEESPAFRTLRDGARLDDGYRAAHPESDGQEATFHGDDGGPIGARVDHVLVSSGRFAAEGAEIVRRQGPGGYPSDHFPVVVDVRW